jgi:hypothetical protein
MSTPVVTEIKVHLEPVTRDTFIDGLPPRSRPSRGDPENGCAAAPHGASSPTTECTIGPLLAGRAVDLLA